jgi:hypothetical protein
LQELGEQVKQLTFEKRALQTELDATLDIAKKDRFVGLTRLTVTRLGLGQRHASCADSSRTRRDELERELKRQGDVLAATTEEKFNTKVGPRQGGVRVWGAAALMSVRCALWCGVVWCVQERVKALEREVSQGKKELRDARLDQDAIRREVEVSHHPSAGVMVAGAGALTGLGLSSDGARGDAAGGAAAERGGGAQARQRATPAPPARHALLQALP